MQILQSTVFTNVMERLGRVVRWVYFEQITRRFNRNYMQLCFKRLHSYFDADLKESNEKLNIGKEQELVQLEQKSSKSNVIRVRIVILFLFKKSMLHALNGLSSPQNGEIHFLLSIRRCPNMKTNCMFLIEYYLFP